MPIAELSCDFDYDVDCDFCEEIDDADTSCENIQHSVESEHDPFLIEKVRELAKKCLERYFEGKSRYDGSKINLNTLSDSLFVELMIKTDISNAVDKAYKIIEKNDFCCCEDNGKTLPEDITYVVSLIHKIQKIVPQDFVGGTLLIHLNLIEGLSLD